MSHPRQKSQLWSHFTAVNEENKVKCLHCEQQLSVANGSTCSLIRHIRKKHPTQHIIKRHFVQRSMNDSARRRRVSVSQLEVLWEFMDTHKELANYNKSAEAQELSKQLWVKVAKALNTNGVGASKDWRGWATYWLEYKARLKKKCIAARGSLNQTDGNVSDVHLNHMETKYLSLLGDDFVNDTSDAQVGTFPVSLCVSEMDSQPTVTETPYHILVEYPQTQQEDAPILDMPQNTTLTPPTARKPSSHTAHRSRSRPKRVSVETALCNLVDINKERLEVEKINTGIFQEMLTVLNRIANNERGPRPPEKTTSNEGLSDLQ